MNDTTTLLRQVNPGWIQDGRFTSQAFNPTRKDAGSLSVYDGDQITPYDSWVHYTQVLCNQSACVVGISVKECQDLELTVTPDPERFPEHVLVGFTGLGSGKRQDVAKKLSQHARNRGRLYP